MSADDFGRRDLIKVTAGAVIAAKTVRGDGHKFFTADEWALADELSEMIIPVDEKSGGARAAMVADYIDSRLAEAFGHDERDAWREGLKRIDALSVEISGVPFLKSTPEQRHALMTRISASEKNPAKIEEKFFVRLKRDTIHAYYTSKIGIHDEMDYKGNVYQQGEYAGYLPD